MHKRGKMVENVTASVAMDSRNSSQKMEKVFRRCIGTIYSNENLLAIKSPDWCDSRLLLAVVASYSDEWRFVMSPFTLLAFAMCHCLCHVSTNMKLQVHCTAYRVHVTFTSTEIGSAIFYICLFFFSLLLAAPYNHLHSACADLTV